MLEFRHVLVLVVAVLLPTVGSGPLSAGDCVEEVLLDGSERIVDFGVDTTDHWWARTQPFEQLQRLWVDGKVYGPFMSVSVPVFSPDGTAWTSVATMNGEISLISNDPIHIEQFTAVSTIVYPAIGSRPWIRYANGPQDFVTNGERTYTLVDARQDLVTDPSGSVVYHTARRGTTIALVRNGTDVLTADDIILAGVWSDGRAVFATSNGGQWALFLGEVELRRGLTAVRSLTVNRSGTVLGGIGGTANASFSFLFIDDYVDIWNGPVLDGITTFALHPFEPLCAYIGIERGASFLYYNSAQYPAGRERGTVTFSHDGDVMAMMGRDMDDFITMNGKRTMVANRLTLGARLALATNGQSFAYSNGVQLVLWDLDRSAPQFARICDVISDIYYSPRTSSYVALGRFGTQLLRIRCTA
jgi:hypothetical protein